MLRPRGSALEVVARTGDWRGPVGALVPRASTASAAHSTPARRWSRPPSGTARPRWRCRSRSAPASSACSRPASTLPRCRSPRTACLGSTASASSSRSRWSATTSAARVERAMTGYASSTNSPLHWADRPTLTASQSSSSTRSTSAFDFDIAGLVLTGWGRDRADVVFAGGVHRADVEHVLGVVSGRDRGYASVREVRRTRSGGVSQHDAEPAEDWALARVRARVRRPRRGLPVRRPLRRRALQRAGPRAARGHRGARWRGLRPRRAVRPHPRRLRQDHRGALGDARLGERAPERSCRAGHGLRDVDRRGDGAELRRGRAAALRRAAARHRQDGRARGDPAQAERPHRRRDGDASSVTPRSARRSSTRSSS